MSQNCRNNKLHRFGSALCENGSGSRLQNTCRPQTGAPCRGPRCHPVKKNINLLYSSLNEIVTFD